jgi:hypothetical protein
LHEDGTRVHAKTMSSAQKTTIKQGLQRVFYFFPLQLVILHFKRNHFLLVFWLLIFGYTMNFLGSNYGISHQFLFPEYRGHNGFLAFAILGFSVGGFILAFNLYTYILHGFRFPFIATLNRPFLKFSVNNFAIPSAFVLVYLYCTINYQIHEELETWSTVLTNVFGLLFGMFIFLVVSLLYFTFTNKNIGAYTTISGVKQKAGKQATVQTNLHKKKDWVKEEKRSADWRIETYMVHFFKIGLARSAKHYQRTLLEKVFTQNHVNASLFELGLIISFIVIGSFRENPYFVIPAAASVVLLFTVLLMLISALFSWVKGWTLTVFIVLFALVNVSFSGLKMLKLENRAYGLEYDGALADYNREYLAGINNQDSLVKQDVAESLAILERWKEKNVREDGKKPKMVIVTASGGGLRSALWTLTSLMHADSVSGGNLMQQTALISGSSGGMLGASYVREIALREAQQQLEKRPITHYQERISKDLLNPVILSMATNDLFIRYQHFNDGDQRYTKDRAYAFEQQLNQNTDGFLDRRLIDYREPEREAIVPIAIFAPSIVNDGRRLLISAQNMSYLCQNTPKADLNSRALAEDVEFLRFFEKQGSANLKFTSALRMNATFPYIMPMVSLPSNPGMEVMDAGLRDNFGAKSSMQFLYTFKDWINENTSGVILLQCRDVRKDFVAEEQSASLINRFTAPLGSVYGNITKTQDYNHDQLLRYLSYCFDGKIDVVTFQLEEERSAKVSLSWHLTTKEKQTIKNKVERADYQTSLSELISLLNP